MSRIDIVFYRVVHKKRGTLLLSISSPVIDRFSKFFHSYILQATYINVVIIYSSAS